jgi:hypothetical protein
MVPGIGASVSTSRNGRDEKEGYFGAIPDLKGLVELSKGDNPEDLLICASVPAKTALPLSNPPPLPPHTRQQNKKTDAEALRQVLSTKPKFNFCPG